MTQDQFGGLVRAIVAALGGYVTGKGLADEATVLAVGGAVVTAAIALWSWWTNRPEKLA